MELICLNLPFGIPDNSPSSEAIIKNLYAHLENAAIGEKIGGILSWPGNSASIVMTKTANGEANPYRIEFFSFGNPPTERANILTFNKAEDFFKFFNEKFPKWDNETHKLYAVDLKPQAK
jgi:hypothetical protein